MLSFVKTHLLLIAITFTSCVRRESWTTKDGGYFTNGRGGVIMYDPTTSHHYRETIVLTRYQPISRNLSDWRLVRIATDGKTTLKFTLPGNSWSVSTKPGEYFPEPGQRRMRLLDASAEEQTARIEVFH